MQRILHFAKDGDTSGFFPQLARWHDRGRYRMLFATLHPTVPRLREYMESQGVACFSCECHGRATYLKGMFRLMKLLDREQVDILHTHLFEPSLVGLGAGWLARTPVRLLTRHYSDYHTRINKNWHVRLDRLCTRLAHGVIAVSRHTADHLIEREQAPSEKVHAIVNGIDFDRVKTSGPGARERIRKEFAAEDAYLLLVAARLHPEKGYEYLFQAMTSLRRVLDRRVLLLVAGDGPLANQCRTQARALGCDGAVRFLGFRNDVPDLMAAADLVVLPSVAEAFGLVLTEALSLGTPVVATRVGGIPEIVTDGVDGVLVPPADSNALRDALAGLLRDPERRRRMGEAGRQQVSKRFRFEDMIRSYEALYDRLAPRKGGRANARSLCNHPCV